MMGLAVLKYTMSPGWAVREVMEFSSRSRTWVPLGMSAAVRVEGIWVRTSRAAQASDARRTDTHARGMIASSAYILDLLVRDGSGGTSATKPNRLSHAKTPRRK